jgi:hypothetical protein
MRRRPFCNVPGELNSKYTIQDAAGSFHYQVLLKMLHPSVILFYYLNLMRLFTLPKIGLQGVRQSSLKISPQDTIPQCCGAVNISAPAPACKREHNFFTEK